MIKIILTTALICASTLAVFSQFSDTGYKNYTLGMTLTQAQAIQPLELESNEYSNDYTALVEVEGVLLELNFYELEEHVSYTIISADEKARLLGYNAPVIGQHRSVIFKEIGNNLEPMIMDEVSEYDFRYLPTTDSASNHFTSCILSFDDEYLNEIIVTHNP